LVLFVLALRHLGTARTGAYFSTAPFLGAVASFALIDEPMSRAVVSAGVLIALGVYLHVTDRLAVRP
jgi:drug/metabolite transporter (DMT)-like permease